MTKDRVLVIQVLARRKRDVELRFVRVRSTVCHGDDTSLVVA
jgi:hypothetical protein